MKVFRGFVAASAAQAKRTRKTAALIETAAQLGGLTTGGIEKLPAQARPSLRPAVEHDGGRGFLAEDDPQALGHQLAAGGADGAGLLQRRDLVGRLGHQVVEPKPRLLGAALAPPERLDGPRARSGSLNCQAIHAWLSCV